MDISFLIVGLIVGTILGYALRRPGALTDPTAPGSPQIVVNVPPEFKPLDTLPPTAIEGARASLWWTVFSAITDSYSPAFSQDEIEDATGAANEAVNSVFGAP